MSAIDQLAATLATMAEAANALLVWQVLIFLVPGIAVIWFVLWSESRTRANPYMAPWGDREPGDLGGGQ